MSRRTGLPLSECFVEFPTKGAAQDALSKARGKAIKCQISSQSELMRALFPTQHSIGINEGFIGTLVMVKDECVFLVDECRKIRVSWFKVASKSKLPATVRKRNFHFVKVPMVSTRAHLYASAGSYL